MAAKKKSGKGKKTGGKKTALIRSGKRRGKGKA